MPSPIRGVNRSGLGVTTRSQSIAQRKITVVRSNQSTSSVSKIKTVAKSSIKSSFATGKKTFSASKGPAVPKSKGKAPGAKGLKPIKAKSGSGKLGPSSVLGTKMSLKGGSGKLKGEVGKKKSSNKQKKNTAKKKKEKK